MINFSNGAKKAKQDSEEEKSEPDQDDEENDYQVRPTRSDLDTVSTFLPEFAIQHAQIFLLRPVPCFPV